ncbi:MAG: MSMEG_1061 family FMN-dependent PPOX-type flavoprotein, partial [Solirubrobacteraceae bacterium]
SYRPPSQGVLDKQLDRLDHHCRGFIAQSPILLLATAGADGSCDVSPRGGETGFVEVLDEHRLRIPDARGNRRLDSFANVLENPHAGLLFLIPGMGETLRVNGNCSVVRDGDAVSLMVEVQEAFLHCAKALLRSRLWDPDSWPATEERPSAAEIFGDHLSGMGTEAATEMLDTSYRHRL